MKKTLITMAVLTVMVAGAMVFSSFATPKTNDEKVCSQINANDGWRKVGVYEGRVDPKQCTGCKANFHVWEKEGTCNSYYWTLCEKNPDETEGATGAVRKDSEERWYCAYNGYNYYINF